MSNTIDCNYVVVNTTDINSDLPPEYRYLKDLVTAFYDTQVKVEQQKADEIEILTRNQGSDESSAHI